MKGKVKSNYYLVFYSVLLGLICIAGHLLFAYFEQQFAHHIEPRHFMYHLLHALFLAVVGALFLVLYSRRRDIEKQKYQNKILSLHADLKNTENQLIRAGKLASVAELAAGVAHEVMNPLASISSYCQLMMRNGNGNSELKVKEFAQKIANEIHRVSRILRDMKSYAKPTPNDEQKHLVNPDEAVREMLDLISIDARFKNIEIDASLFRHDFYCFISKERLKQVILNLLINAADAMPQGGRLRIVSRKRFNGTSPGIYTLSIRDTGIGIDPKNNLRVYEPFFTTKPEGKGTGLGLSVSQKIINDFQGHLYFKSKRDKGSVFVIELPNYRKQENLQVDKIKELSAVSEVTYH